MLHHDTELLDLVGAIHAGAADPEAEAAALAQLSDAFDGAGVIHALTPLDGGPNELRGARLAPLTAEAIRGPGRHVHYNPALPHVLPVGRIIQPEHMWHQVVPTGERFTDSALFRHIATSGYRYLACGAARRTSDLAQTLVLLRGPASPFEAGELQLTELLLPHLARAEQTRRALGAALSDRAAALAATDALGRGVILLDARGRLRAANAMAEAMLGRNDGLGHEADGLMAARAEDTARLRRLIGLAAATAIGRGWSSGGALSLPRPSGEPPLAILVAPLSGRWRDGLDGAAAVLVVVSDPAQHRRVQAHMLEALYGLTPAEARVAAALAQAMGLPQAARELGISPNTAKTHATRVFNKLGVEGHAQLVLKVATALG